MSPAAIYAAELVALAEDTESEWLPAAVRQELRRQAVDLAPGCLARLDPEALAALAGRARLAESEAAHLTRASGERDSEPEAAASAGVLHLTGKGSARADRASA